VSDARPIIGIAAKPQEPKAKRLCQEVIAWLDSKSLDYRVDATVAETLDQGAFDPGRVINRQDIALHCDPIVVLGGDGTLLSVCRHAFAHPPTVIGVNVGRLGFLAEIEFDELYSVIEDAIVGKAPTELRPLLEAQIMRTGSLFALYHAVNDVVITKEALARIIALEIAMDDQPATIIRGDGLIVSSPAGSTAYSLAAGGSIVHPGVEALLVTPICPHSLSNRPLVLPGSSLVSMRICAADQGSENQVILTMDGQEGTPLQDGDVVVVKFSNRGVRLVRSPSRNYFETLKAKLGWGDPDRAKCQS
jgi:NAD+ kinase